MPDNDKPRTTLREHARPRLLIHLGRGSKPLTDGEILAAVDEWKRRGEQRDARPVDDAE